MTIMSDFEDDEPMPPGINREEDIHPPGWVPSPPQASNDENSHYSLSDSISEPDSDGPPGAWDDDLPPGVDIPRPPPPPPPPPPVPPPVFIPDNSLMDTLRGAQVKPEFIEIMIQQRLPREAYLALAASPSPNLLFRELVKKNLMPRPSETALEDLPPLEIFDDVEGSIYPDGLHSFLSHLLPYCDDDITALSRIPPNAIPLSELATQIFGAKREIPRPTIRIPSPAASPVHEREPTPPPPPPSPPKPEPEVKIRVKQLLERKRAELAKRKAGHQPSINFSQIMNIRNVLRREDKDDNTMSPDSFRPDESSQESQISTPQSAAMEDGTCSPDVSKFSARKRSPTPPRGKFRLLHHSPSSSDESQRSNERRLKKSGFEPVDKPAPPPREDSTGTFSMRLSSTKGRKESLRKLSFGTEGENEDEFVSKEAEERKRKEAEEEAKRLEQEKKKRLDDSKDRKRDESRRTDSSKMKPPEKESRRESESKSRRDHDSRSRHSDRSKREADSRKKPEVKIEKDAAVKSDRDTKSKQSDPKKEKQKIEDVKIKEEKPIVKIEKQEPKIEAIPIPELPTENSEDPETAEERLLYEEMEKAKARLAELQRKRIQQQQQKREEELQKMKEETAKSVDAQKTESRDAQSTSGESKDPKKKEAKKKKKKALKKAKKKEKKQLKKQKTKHTKKEDGGEESAMDISFEDREVETVLDRTLKRHLRFPIVGIRTTATEPPLKFSANLKHHKHLVEMIDRERPVETIVSMHEQDFEYPGNEIEFMETMNQVPDTGLVFNHSNLIQIPTVDEPQPSQSQSSSRENYHGNLLEVPIVCAAESTSSGNSPPTAMLTSMPVRGNGEQDSPESTTGPKPCLSKFRRTANAKSVSFFDGTVPEKDPLALSPPPPSQALLADRRRNRQRVPLLPPAAIVNSRSDSPPPPPPSGDPTVLYTIDPINKQLYEILDPGNGVALTPGGGALRGPDAQKYIYGEVIHTSEMVLVENFLHLVYKFPYLIENGVE